jgi:DUF1680 family protein
MKDERLQHADLSWDSARAPERRVCSRISGAKMNLDGWVRQYLAGITEQWLKVAPTSNPSILEMFRDRDRRPLREMVPWAGEFAGKYLTCAVQVYRVKGDPALREIIADFVRQFISLQAEDGYLGPWAKDDRLTGQAPNSTVHIFRWRGPSTGPSPAERNREIFIQLQQAETANKRYNTWDAWGHYHAMLGLLLWYDESGDAAALTSARKIGDLLCDKFETKRLVDIGSTAMNLAPIHSLCLLYEHTGNARYLRLAERIRDEFAATDARGKPLAGDYVNGPLAGKEFYQLPLPGPRWESLHSVMGLAELYAITGDEKSRQAFEKIWWSIVKGDRHNNGGFSSHESACGDPYNKGPIETCCTIAWIALGVEMLRLTGDSVIADELEFSTFNSVVGLHSPNGRWVTYNTPMDGVRRASGDDIVFQAREGAPELNCCSVNGARGFGMISDWALMAFDGGLVLNWYGPGSITAPLPARSAVTLEQETQYPLENRVRLKVRPNEPAKFSLKLRIPYWSRVTNVRLNADSVPDVEPGRYLVLDRIWNPGDTVDIEFDFSLQYWAGEGECAGKVSIYRGPILLTYDRRFNPFDPDQVPALDARNLVGKTVATDGWLPPIVLMEFKAGDGRTLRLCDFGSAGVGGSPYRSWLDVTHCTKTEFSKTNPRRSSPVDASPRS